MFRFLGISNFIYLFIHVSLFIYIFYYFITFSFLFMLLNVSHYVPHVINELKQLSRTPAPVH